MTESKRDRALAMRKEGATYQQICDEVGVSMGSLCYWIRKAGLQTGRYRVGNELREVARQLRAQGKTYTEIREVTGLPKSTISSYVSGIPLNEEHAALIRQKQDDARLRAAATNRAHRMQRANDAMSGAAAEIDGVSDEQLFVAGVIAYWAEGAKLKPWRTSVGVSFANSDPTLIRLFLRWLELVGIERDRIYFELHIHERADTDGALRYWSRITGMPSEAFAKPTLKRHNPRTNRRNVGQGYVGCLNIKVRRGASLNRQIAGWYVGIARALGIDGG